VSSQLRLDEGDLLRVGHVDQFSEAELRDLIQFIDKEHYLHYPFNEDGSANPYQYCYGLGYLSRQNYLSRGLWAGFVAGIYPNAGFWKEHFPLLVGQRGLGWLFRHAANIYRIVAFYQDDANALLKAYEQFCYRTKRSKILFALPTRKERDAVCNYEWFEVNGFKNYGETGGSGARIYAKVLDFEPVEQRETESLEQFAELLVTLQEPSPTEPSP
jgi:hypothetical protein